MSNKITKRQQNILINFRFNQEYAFEDIANFFVDPPGPSRATLRRDIANLRDKGFLTQSGERRGTKYQLTHRGLIEAPLVPRDYLALDIDQRLGNTGFNFDLFQGCSGSLFNEDARLQMEAATQMFQKKSKGASEVICHKELERFVIELSWKSSKIEGNTYTLLDTERLLKEGIEAKGHTRDEAIMILNHKKTFQYVVEHKFQMKKLSIQIIENIHRFLVEGLGVSFGLRTKPVGVTGSLYVPLSVSSQIQEALHELCCAIDRLTDPHSKSLLALMGISYIQPFEDGNKRTARLVANAILLAYDCAPLSYRSVDEIQYRESMLVFYEKNSLSPMRDIFQEQYIFSCEHYLQF